MNKKYLITKRPNEYKHLQEAVGFEFCGFSTLLNDIQQAKRIQFDTETSYIDTKKHPELSGTQHKLRELYVLQFGMNKNRYVIDYYGFTEQENNALKVLFEHDTPFILHNAAFDYTVLKAKLGIELRNMHDTFLMSKVLNMGTTFEEGYHSLGGCVERFLGVVLDKTEQKGFTGEPMTLEQLEYSFDDVLYLEDLYDSLEELLKIRKVFKVYDEVERRVIAPLCDMGLNRMRFDKEHWAKVGEHLKEEREDYTDKLLKEVFKDPGLVEYLKDDYDGMPLITAHDVFDINWRSPKFKKLAYSLLFPKYDYLELSTKQKLNKIAKTEEDEECKKYFQDIIAGDYFDLNNILKSKYKEELNKGGYHIPANTSMINWNSSPQKLKIFNYYYPQLTSTGQKVIARLSNPLLSVYRNFSGVNKSCSTYGENFVRNYVDENSTIAPVKLGQILDTGRMSYGILLQIPAKDIFRNAFLPPEEDWVFVDSDYSSAEVVLMAKAANEEGLLNVIKEGKDLHCYSASIVFGQEWIDAAEPDCEWMKTGHQCKCPKHAAMRKKSKAITFGLCYGIGPVGLGDQLDIPKSEASALMIKYFEGFPKLKEFLDNAEKEGLEKLEFTCLPPYSRKAFFQAPVNKMDESSIGRRCKNLSFQEGNATITKIALIMIDEAIKKNNYPVKLHLPIHDEILSSCPRPFAKEWARLQADFMVKAGEVVVGKGLLKVDTDVFIKWGKDSKKSILGEL